MKNISFSRMQVGTNTRGFTIVELVIVINIIGLLFISLYPSLTSYLERGRQLDAKIAIQKFVGVFNDYIIEKGAIVGQPPQMNNSWEGYMIPIDPTDPGGPSAVAHIGLRDYFHATAERRKILEEVIKKTMWLDGRGIYFMITPHNEASNYWWPGRAYSDTKRTWLWFYLPANNSSYNGLASSSDRPYAAFTWNGVNYSAGYGKVWYGSGAINNNEMDKYCFGGGQAGWVNDGTSIGTVVECDYWF